MKSTRFVSLDCGRRWGKTTALQVEGIERAFARPHQMIWWVDPTYPLAKRAYRAFKLSIPKDLVTRSSDSDFRIELVNASVIEIQSAEKGDNLRGEGVNTMLINEASLIKRKTWDEILRPMLSDTGGGAVFAYTPKGQGHWTYEMWMRGNSPEWPDHASLQFPTSDNPRIPDQEIEDARRALPDKAFRQEYLAEFLEDGAGVFSNVRGCAEGVLDKFGAMPLNGPYVGGLDLARTEDFTVLTIMDASNHVCWWERFNHTSWTRQRERIIEAVKNYNAYLLVDRGSIGDVIYEDLQMAGISCEPFTFTNQSKADIIQGLQVALERKEVTYPYIEALINELTIYQYEVTPGGVVRYNAPDGFHDDCCISLALAVEARRVSHGRSHYSYLNGLNIRSLIHRAA
jgi:hypothetical protein